MDARPLSLASIGALAMVVVVSLARPGASATTQEFAAPARREQPAASIPAHRTGAALLADFLGESSSGGDSGVPYVVRTSIVILPDPVDSRLDWAYDAGIESVRRAHERAGYVIDRFWLPWRGTHPDSAGGAAGGNTPPVRATHPGVLLFRSRDVSVPHAAGDRGDLRQLSIVYVVGETPTSGVAKEALYAALEERDRLRAVPGAHTAAAPDDTVRIVGPVFSGSIPSLRLALERWSGAAGGAVRPPVLVRTGAATNTSNAALLTEATGPALRIVYATTVHPFGNLERAMVETIEARLGVPRRRIALLVESTTQFGRFAGDSYDRQAAASNDAAEVVEPLRVPFPINISSVRNGYSRDPRVIATMDSAARAGGARVTLPLAGSPWVTDNPVVISRLTPAIVEMALTDIAHILDEQDVAAVGVVATDIQDRIFMLSEVKRRLRDVQLFTFGSNVLLTRPDVNASLRGTLVFSTYPLIAGSELRTNGAREPLVFGSDIAQGIYNAMALTLGSSGALVEYDLPAGTRGTLRSPPVWVSTIGKNAMYPVVAHGPPVLAGNAADATQPVARLTRAGRLGGSADRRPLAATATLALAALACVFAINALHGRRERCPPEHPDDLAEGIRAPRAERGRSMERAHLVVQSELYAALGVSALAGLLLIALLVLGHGRLGWANMPWRAAFLVVGALVGVPLLVRMVTKAVNLARTLNRGWWRSHRDLVETWPLYREEAIAAGIFVGGVAYVLLLGDVLWHIGAAAEAVAIPLDPGTLADAVERLNAESLVSRAVAVGSGVSPLAPVFVIGAGLAAWAAWHIRRLNLLADAPAFEQVLLTRFPNAASPIGRSREAELDDSGARMDAAAVRLPDDLAIAGLTAPSSSAAPPLRREPAAAGGGGPHARGATAAQAPARTSPPDLWARALGAVPEDWWPRRPLVDRVVYPPPPAPMLATPGLACELRRIRVGLARLVPGGAFQLVLVMLVLGACVLVAEFSRTLETVAFAETTATFVSRAVASFGRAFGGAAASGALTSFDLLLRAGILAGLAGTIWSLARFLRVWHGLRDALDRIGATPLHATFRTLPRTVARLTRLSPFDLPSQSFLQSVTYQEWTELRRWSAARGVPIAAHPPRLESPYGAQLVEGRALEPLVQALETQWAEDAQARFAAAAVGAADGAPVPSPTPHPWTVAASRCVAIYVVEYVEWVFSHLRTLAVFLLTSLLLLTALLASYPFQPQGMLRSIFALVLVATVIAIVTVLLQMDRHDLLSEIGQTDAGRVNVSWPLLRNILTFAVIPVLVFLSTEIPTLQQLLLVWLAPLMRAFGG